MIQSNTTKDMTWENVKVRRWVVNLMRQHKEKKDVPILRFVEKAVLEKLEKEKQKSK